MTNKLSGASLYNSGPQFRFNLNASVFYRIMWLASAWISKEMIWNWLMNTWHTCAIVKIANSFDSRFLFFQWNFYFQIPSMDSKYRTCLISFPVERMNGRFVLFFFRAVEIQSFGANLIESIFAYWIFICIVQGCPSCRPHLSPLVYRINRRVIKIKNSFYLSDCWILDALNSDYFFGAGPSLQ